MYRVHRVTLDSDTTPGDSSAPPNPSPTQSEAIGAGARAFVDWIVVVAVALTVAFLVRGFVLAHFVVEGSSMDSTLTTGDRVFVNKLSYRLHDPNRGDVVVLHQLVGIPGSSMRPPCMACAQAAEAV